MGIASYIINKVLPAQITKITRVLAFSTTTPLGANAVYTSPTVDMINYKVYSAMINTDQGGSFVLQYSDDGTTWYNGATSPSTVTANAPTPIGANLCHGRYYRIIYTNGATAQGAFHISSYLMPL